MRKTLCVFLALFALAAIPATAQFHHNTGPVVWTWPKPIDAKSADNQKQLSDIAAWLGKHGYTGGYQTVFDQIEAVPVPGGENPPNWPYVAFCLDQVGKGPTLQFDRSTFEEFVKLMDNRRCQVSDFALVLKMPSTLLVELQHRFQFGDPSVGVPYPDPKQQPAPAPVPPPVKPANPVGKEFSTGKFYALDPSVTDYTDERGHFLLRTRETPFGQQFWFEQVQ